MVEEWLFYLHERLEFLESTVRQLPSLKPAL